MNLLRALVVAVALLVTAVAAGGLVVEESSAIVACIKKKNKRMVRLPAKAREKKYCSCKGDNPTTKQLGEGANYVPAAVNGCSGVGLHSN